MRVPTSLSGLFASPPARRATACGRCGDSFFGSPAAGRSWLLAHHSEEHRQRPAVPVQPPALDRPTPRRAPVLREPVAASRT
jgi:hypothetical protein